MKKQPKIGLALGSGAARGLSHIGVLKVLERNSIPIDYISGSSIGAVIGALYSVTRNVGQMEKIVNSADWKLFLSLLDPSLSQGLLRGKKIRKFIFDFLGTADFKDLKIPIVIAATDLNTGETIYLENGDLCDAIMASCAIPLIFQPIKLGGRALVDGGLSAPLPIKVLKNMGAGKIIAVNLDGDFFTRRKEKFSVGELAWQSINLLRYHLAERDAVEADVLVVPEVGDIWGHEFLNGKKAIAAGEKAAQKVLPGIKKLI
ncbi:MAG: patatin-like phospholipase family protein [Candidatus Magasanikbacteria bacterium]|nr:patatin-like phospholipase family protein [Candidatus Magasanikbacteria bacterium]